MRDWKIEAADEQYARAAKERWDSLTKPRESLGKLEEVVCRICAIQRTLQPDTRKKRLIVFAADHGITEEGVSAYPAEVTAQMVRGFIQGKSAISILARRIGIDLQIVDTGVKTQIPGCIQAKVRPATRNFLKEPAMTLQETHAAIETGYKMALQASEDGVTLLAGGEMGIGNTTSASAIFSLLFAMDPAQVTGSGAGLDERGRENKIAILRRALDRIPEKPGNAVEILRQVGGYEIAALMGLYLGSVERKIPIVIDGFICTAATALAVALRPDCKSSMIFSHQSAEQGYAIIAQALALQPLLHLDMKLGEGTGAAIAMQIIDHAVALFREMPTFAEAGVSDKS